MSEAERQFIQDFRLERFQINLDGSSDPQSRWYRKALTKAVEQLATGLYEKDSHFIMELIQNAEDNHYSEGIKPELRFVLLDNDPTNTAGSDGCLCVFNNESGFQPRNIESICDVGASTKSKIDGYVGEKGIGFKSVYIVSASPHIFSNGYQFKFYEDDPNYDLNYIVPYWVDDVPEVVKQANANTSLLLPLKAGQKQKIIDHLSDISPESILFLNKLSGLSIEVESDNTQLSFKRVMLDEHRCELQVSNRETVEKRQYWLHKEVVDVDPEVKEEKREGITEREISLALPLDDHGISGKVFSYLPTEADSGFPFLVNADFMLTANRESIQTERAWNIWLRDQLSEVIFRALLDIRRTGVIGNLVYSFVPKPLEDPTDLYFDEVSKVVCNRLSESLFVLSDQNEIILPAAAKLANKQIHSLFEDEDRPEWFAEKTFVHTELRKYSARLKAISVETFDIDDLMECLDDERWLEKRNNKWFVELYRYFLKSTGSDIYKLSKKNVFPLEDGSLIKPLLDVYWTDTPESSAELDKLVEGSGIPAVNFLNSELLALVRAQEDVFKWLFDELSLRRFSFQVYLVSTLLPWLNTNVDEVSDESLLVITQLILNRWGELHERAIEAVGSKLPFVLEHSSELDSCELVVPRGYDSELGWQNIFKEAHEYSHLNVLSTAYLGLDVDDKTLSSFMKCIGATAYPLFGLKRITSIIDHVPESRRFLNKVLNNSNQRSTRTKVFETQVFPLFLLDEEKCVDDVNRFSLIKWLECQLPDRQSKLVNGCLSWFYRTALNSHYDSLLFQTLKSRPWVNTTVGLRKPSEVFLASETLRSIFGDSLPYLKDTMSLELCELLGVKSEATAESLVDLLKAMSGSATAEHALIDKIYRYLHDYCDDFSDDFINHKLIYIPDSVKSWYSADEVIWEEASQAFGDSFGWLSSAYPSLHNFFVDELSIKEEVDDQAVLDAWINLQTSGTTPEKTKDYLSFAIPKVIKMIKEDSDSGMLESFFEDAEIWVQDSDWCNPSWENVYIPDNDKLRRLFTGEVSFPWRRDNYSHPQQSLLYDKFNLPKLSESVEYFVGSGDGFEARDSNELLTNYSVRLICELIANNDKNDDGTFRKYVDSGFIFALVHTVEKQGSGLQVEVKLDSVDIKKLPEAAAFLDIGQKVLFIDESADEDDVKDDAAESLARVIWPRNFKAYTDTVRNILGVKTEKRYKKLHGDKGWSFSPENRKLLESIVGKPTEVIVETPLPEESESATSLPIKSDSLDKPALSEKSASSSPSEIDNLEREVSGDSVAPVSTYPRSASGQGSSHKTPNKNSEKVSSPDATRQSSQSASKTKNRVGNSGSVANRASGHRVSKRRSKTVNTQQVNRARRNRVLTYIHSDLTDPLEKSADGEAKQKARRALGEAAEKRVLDDLLSKGYKAHLMSTNNQGYDIEAVNTQTGEVYYVEVKGNYDTWSAKGVGVSSSQYKLATAKQQHFLLAVVDDLQGASPNIYYVRDPISCITEYRLDHMWAKLATDIEDLSSVGSEVGVLDELLELTDDEHCRYLIVECDKKGYPLPEVGIELSNDSEEIIFENIELAWEDEYIAVVLDQDSLDQLIDLKPDWKVYLADESVIDGLDEAFSAEFNE